VGWDGVQPAGPAAVSKMRSSPNGITIFDTAAGRAGCAPRPHPHRHGRGCLLLLSPPGRCGGLEGAGVGVLLEGAGVGVL
jgi:hypothetical protein